MIIQIDDDVILFFFVRYLIFNYVKNNIRMM